MNLRIYRSDEFKEIWYACSGIISVGRMHLYLPLFHHRDYFGRLDASLSGSFAPQGLFLANRIHLYLALFLHRDYFDRPDASLACSFSPQGLFPPAGFISILLFFSTGIISAGRIHLYPALFYHRDYFAPVRCISILLFCSAGIISTGQIHLYLALFLHRDYFGRPVSSLSCSFSPQGLFRSAGCFSPFPQIVCGSSLMIKSADSTAADGSILFIFPQNFLGVKILKLVLNHRYLGAEY